MEGEGHAGSREYYRSNGLSINLSGLCGIIVYRMETDGYGALFRSYCPDVRINSSFGADVQEKDIAGYISFQRPALCCVCSRAGFRKSTVKQAIREEVLRKRNHIPREVRSVKNLLIKERMISLPEFVSSHTILFYASFRSEAETSGMIKESIGAGKRVLLPKVDRENKKLWLYEIKDISELSPGYMGIPEPSLDDGRIVSPENIDLVVIPGAGFDYSGNRLGYGAGYYDRLLSETGGKLVIVAPAFEEQIVDMIPAEGHDVKVNIIVTDKRILRV